MKLTRKDRPVTLRFSQEDRLSPELTVSFKPYTCDINLKYEPVILDRELSHIGLSFDLEGDVELDYPEENDKYQREIGVGLSFMPSLESDSNIGYTAR